MVLRYFFYNQLKVLLVSTSAFVFFIGFSGNSYAAVVSFDTDMLTVSPGDNFTLTVQGSDFPGIMGGGLNFDFDSSILQINQVTINQSVFEFYIGNGIEEGELDHASGMLSNTAFNTFAGAAGNFDIMTIYFTALAEGTSQLSISESSIWVFSDIYGNAIGGDITYASADISVTAVPLPGALWLFGSGLLVLFKVKRRAVLV